MWVKLTHRSGDMIWINMDQIIFMSDDSGVTEEKLTMLMYGRNEDQFLWVKETADEIVAALAAMGDHEDIEEPPTPGRVNGVKWGAVN